MLKRNITYTNPFTEQEVTEEYYFHLSKADMAEMELEENKTKYTKQDGEGNNVELTGMQAKLQRIVDSEDGKAILVEFKDMIRRSYGKKVGERFVKNREIWEEFSGSEAYSQLLFELCTDAEKGAEFFNGILPAGLAEEAAATVAAQSNDGTALAAVEAVADATGAEFPKPVEVKYLTSTDLASMDSEDLKAGLASGQYKIA